ncbi:plasmid mobilization relaxosome protein MobC [Acetobacter persici]|uniref:plasmid mobilization relaxosome protein MobC n=1 Tax=Acetobacter persici TaxID=1076596 RepID=UPI0036DDF37E
MKKYNQKKRDISKNPRTHGFKIRLNDQEYERIKLLYGSEQMAPKARRILLDYVADGENSVSQELRNLQKEISAIGNNLNQIARHLNSGGNSSINVNNEIYKIKHAINRKLLLIR